MKFQNFNGIRTTELQSKPVKNIIESKLRQTKQRNGNNAYSKWAEKCYILKAWVVFTKVAKSFSEGN